MLNILLISKRDFFIEDMKAQLPSDTTAFLQTDSSLTPDVIILDEQTERLPALTASYPQTPVFLLLPIGTETSSLSELVSVVFKPFILHTFLDKVETAEHLTSCLESFRVRFSHYELSPLHKTLADLQSGDVFKLTEKEVAVIRYLYNNTDRIVSKSELLQEVWGYHPDASTHTIETHIYRLRQKIEKENADVPFIMTEDGGYILVK